MKVREASFALRVVRRSNGTAGIVYRRTVTEKHEERLKRIASISPLAFTAGTGLLREAVKASEGPQSRLSPGPFHSLDFDWGARVACFALVARGLRSADRLSRAAENIRHADGSEAAWWLGLMNNGHRTRAVRALRVLTEAVN